MVVRRGIIFWPICCQKKTRPLDPGLRHMADEARAISLKSTIDANAARGAYGSQMRQFMDRYDFLVTPTLATSAFDVGQLSPLDDDGNAPGCMDAVQLSRSTSTQQPAASVNCGFAANSLPVGLQIVGRMFDDRGVLAASYAYETSNPLYDRTPSGL